jgi:hypothetical protein
LSQGKKSQPDITATGRLLFRYLRARPESVRRAVMLHGVPVKRRALFYAVNHSIDDIN